MATASPDQLYAAARKAGWNPAQSVIAVAIALGESGGKIDAVSPTNTNGTTDYGPWQVNSVHGYDSSKLTTDLQYSANAAYAIYKKQGWKAWTVWKTGAFRSHLSEAQSAKSNEGKNGIVDGLLNAVAGPLGSVNGLLGSPIDPSDLAGGIIDAPGDALSGIDAIGNFFGKLDDAETWKKVGFVVGGSLLIGIATLIIAAEFMQKVPTPVSAVTKAIK